MAEGDVPEHPKRRLDILLGVYVSEIWWLCHEVKTACEAVFAETPMDGDYLQVSPRVNSFLVSVLVNSARIWRFVAAPRANQKKQGQGAEKVSELRSEMLGRLLEGLDLSELKNTKIRNTVEHLDEYLDEALSRFLHRPLSKVS